MGIYCIVCGRNALVTVKNEGGVGEQQKLLSLWKKDCAETLCEILFGSYNFVNYFEAADFCSSCQKTTRDVNFTWKLINKLKCQLEDLSTMVRKRLLVNNYNIQQKDKNINLDEFMQTVLDSDNDWNDYSYDEVVQIFSKVACKVSGMSELSDITFSFDELFPDEVYQKKPECFKTDEFSLVKIEIDQFEGAEDLNENLEDPVYDKIPGVDEESYLSSEEESKNKIGKGNNRKRSGVSKGKNKRVYTPGERRKYYDRAKDTIPCQIESCDQKFRSKKEMDAHFLHFHKGIARPFGCSMCPKKYKWARSVKYHMMTAHSSDKRQFQYFCKYCSKGYTSEEEMKGHAREHLKGPNPFICVLCPVVCTNFVALKMHVQQIHPDVEKPKCEECGKVFVSNVTLKSHRILHQDPSTLFKCPICPHVAATQNRLKIHLVSHDDSRRFYCETCGKGFKDHRALRIHLVKHTGATVYECKICGKGFRSGSSGRRHEEVFHLQIKNYVCQICGRPFGNKSHLTDHLKIHQRESVETSIK